MSKQRITENEYYDINFSANLCVVEKNINEGFVHTTFLYVYNDMNKIYEIYSRVISSKGTTFYKEVV
mgnify:CR=1 FL=1